MVTIRDSYTDVLSTRVGNCIAIICKEGNQNNNY